MSFTYNAVWDDTMALTRRHAPLLIAIAGVFVFLPSLLFAVYFPQPEPRTQDPARALQLLLDYWEAAAPWLLLQGLVNMIGTAAMLRLVFARESTVGAALVFGLLLLPSYFAVSLLAGLIVGGGFLLLIVPGLYLAGRIAVASSVMVAEERRNPLAAIARSFELTKGRGWAVFGLLFIVGLVGAITVTVAGALAGILFLTAAGTELGTFLTTIVTSALAAAFATLIVMLYAAIYRALVPAPSMAAAFE